jgi:glycylpeptide N-tetradecanoyltransferase
MKLNDNIGRSTQIVNNTFKRNEQTVLPQGYTWNKVDICDEKNMTNVSSFLSQHYKRGTESQYKVIYTNDLIRWQMCNNGYFMTVNDNQNNIVGLIGYTHRTLQLYSDRMTITEPLYMCCLPNYRNKGIARVLMDETIRQSNMMGINKGLFCNNRIVPTPIATIRQYSRPINYKKLREQDFVSISGIDDTLAHDRTKIKLRPSNRYIVAENTTENINIVYRLYNEYMNTFNLHLVMSKQELTNYLFNDNYVKTILVLDEKSRVVDFISYNFYDILNPNRETDNIIKTANILMYSSIETRVDLLFINVLKHINKDKIHLLYINDMMHTNDAILSSLKLSTDDTDDEEEHATYDLNIIKTSKKTFINLYNWQCEKFKQNMVSWLIF